MATQDQPQELIVFQVALVLTSENPRRPRMLIMSAPSVEGADLVKIAEQWLTAARTPNSFPAIHDLHANTGLDLNIGGLSAPARPFPTPTVRVNEDHPAFNPPDAPPESEDGLTELGRLQEDAGRSSGFPLKRR